MTKSILFNVASTQLINILNGTKTLDKRMTDLAKGVL